MADCTERFVNYLVDQTPHFAPDIIKAIHPMSGTWIGKVQTKPWPSFMGNFQYFDKYEQVFANPTRQWVTKEYAACTGKPCDPTSDKIGWGWSRYGVYKETRSIETDLLCFDQIRDVSHAEEHAAQIIDGILKYATDTIMSYYMRKRACLHAKRKTVADTNMTDFTYDWVADADGNEIYIDTDVDPESIDKLTPQHLQRAVFPLRAEGYFQTNVIGPEIPRLIEFMTDETTLWDLDKQGQTYTGTELIGNWRFTDWQAANDFWKYGMSGQLGNYIIDVDPWPLRFYYKGRTGGGLYRYQLVLPYRNVSAATTDGTESWTEGHGLRMEPNPAFDAAPFQFSIVWHRAAGTVYVAQAEDVHPQMKFTPRDLAGKWQFVNHDLGCENIRGNKGKFFADFELAWKPEHPEWSWVFFHAREQACIPQVRPCNAYYADPISTTQYYSSENEQCATFWDLVDCEEGEGLEVPAYGITVNGVPLAFEGTTCVADLDALVTALNSADVSKDLGTWAAEDADGDGEDELVLQDPLFDGIDVIIECCTPRE